MSQNLKFAIIKRGKGVINSTNPITEENVFQIDGGAALATILKDIESQSYRLEIDDLDKWLNFLYAGDSTLVIPDGVFLGNDEVRGMAGAYPLTIVPVNEYIIVNNSNAAIIIEPYGEFIIKFYSPYKCAVTGDFVHNDSGGGDGGIETETDPTVPSHVKNITSTEKDNWNTAFSWGDHSQSGYLTSFDESDLVHKSGDETITGKKTITDHLTFEMESGDYYSYGYMSKWDFIYQVDHSIVDGTGGKIQLVNGDLTLDVWGEEFSQFRMFDDSTYIDTPSLDLRAPFIEFSEIGTSASGGEYLVYTANGVERRTAAEVVNDLNLGGTGGTADGNDFVDEGNFNTSTGQISLDRTDGGVVSFPMDGRYELIFSKNSAFNKNFGTSSGTVAQGNDSRINNGQTAYNKRITNVTITGTNTKTITITLADNSTVTGSFTDMVGESGTSDGNDYTNEGSFNTSTGVVTLNRTDGGTVTFDLDGRYEQTFSKNSAFNRDFGGNGSATTVARSDHYHPPKEVESSNSGTSVSQSSDPDKWKYLTGSNPTYTINTGAATKDTELEGVFMGTGELTIVGGTGVTINYPSELTNKIPPNGVYGVKFVEDNVGILFGTLIPAE